MSLILINCFAFCFAPPFITSSSFKLMLKNRAQAGTKMFRSLTVINMECQNTKSSPDSWVSYHNIFIKFNNTFLILRWFIDIPQFHNNLLFPNFFPQKTFLFWLLLAILKLLFTSTHPPTHPSNFYGTDPKLFYLIDIKSLFFTGLISTNSTNFQMLFLITSPMQKFNFCNFSDFFLFLK